MRPQSRPASRVHPFSLISATPKSFLAALLSVACLLPASIELPARAATPTATKDTSLPPSADKKPRPEPALKGLPTGDLTADEAIVHALNRLAYGPRPGDIERIRQMGLAKWIDQQLNPNSIDDKVVEARLADYPTLHMSSAKLIDNYPQPKQAEKQAEKRAQAQAQSQTQPQTQALQDPNMSRSDSAAAVVARDMQRTPSASANSSTAAAAPVSDTQPVPDTSGDPAPMKQPANSTNSAGRRDALGGGDPNNVQRALADDSKRPARVVAELSMAKVTRAIYSQRQLQQVMDDFWFNHFNVFAGKGEDRYYLTSYERDVIQPHALGKFKDLVNATAKSPAMLFYLDNFLSADPRAAQRLAAERAARQQWRRGRFGMPPPPANPQQAAKKNERGLNENYGRELMELHTLGVDGGYTQKDVTEVARCFTGWTIEKPRQYPEFKFDERLHDPDPKFVLGKKINSGGMKDGEIVIDMLVHHPSTARFISTKLARRFVSDTPPQSLVDRMVQTFQSSDGDIKAVLHTMIWSPEFWSRDAYRAKIKTPYELVISAVRTLGTDVDTPLPLVQWVGRIGEPLYQCQPPTGYSDKADTWVNTGALLNRLNYSLALAGNRVRGARTDVASLLGVDPAAEPKAVLDRAVQVFLTGQAATGTVETLEKQLDNPQILQARLDDPRKQVDLGVVAGLVLGAPEFQRR